MMNKYDYICGLTGSKASPAESEFLKEIYKSQDAIVPPFLNTCDGVVKVQPHLIDDCAYIYNDEDNQFIKLAEMAESLSERVPVLIITETAAIARRLQAQMNNRSEYKEDRIQLFLQYDSNGMKMKWKLH